MGEKTFQNALLMIDSLPFGWIFPEFWIILPVQCTPIGYILAMVARGNCVWLQFRSIFIIEQRNEMMIFMRSFIHHVTSCDETRRYNKDSHSFPRKGAQNVEWLLPFRVKVYDHVCEDVFFSFLFFFGFSFIRLGLLARRVLIRIYVCLCTCAIRHSVPNWCDVSYDSYSYLHRVLYTPTTHPRYHFICAQTCDRVFFVFISS